jgi:hypothetical protein
MNPIAETHISSAESQRLAAEEAALQLGWLSECPYHGEPFRTGDAHAKDPEAIATVPADVIALVTEVCDGFSDTCPFCARESTIPE